MGDPVVVSAVRTPIGRANRGGLVDVDVFELAKVVVGESLKASNVPAEDLQDLVLGEVLQGGGNVARHTATDLGLDHVPGAAVQRACASGLQALNTVSADIRSGMTRAAIAGGSESMTRAPQVFRTRRGAYSGVEPWISPTHPDSPEAPNLNMGVTVGENAAEEVGVSREEQDEWAYHSHQRALAAIDDGRMAEEIVAVEVPAGRRETRVVDTDEQPRRDTSVESLAQLPAMFKAGGTVTAGNASGINDGAAAMVVVDEDHARDRGLEALAVVRGWAAVGVEPRRTGLAPSEAIPLAVERAGLRLDDISLFEINEAFAAMAVASSRVLGLDHEVVNVNGGAVGLGHPVACSGARIVVTLIHELRRRGGGYGVASLCAGGGLGAATVIEVPKP